MAKTTKDKVQPGVEVRLHDLFLAATDDFALDAEEFNEQEVAKIVRRRYGDRAFCFRPCFYVKGEKLYKPELRGWIFFSGSVRTREEILKENCPSEETLRKNLIYDENIPAVIQTGNRHYPFYKMDKILETPE